MKAISFFPGKEEIHDYFGSQDFLKALFMTVAMVTPIVIGVKWDVLDIAKLVALGVFYASPSDSTGSLRLKVNGMLLATLLALLVTLIFSFLKVPLWALIPIIGGFVFVISYLSVYGFRASLISFSGLFALILSFSPFADSDISLFQQIIYIGLGGIWYVGLVLLRQLLFPKSASEYYLKETIKLTGEYFEIRGKLIDKKNDRKTLVKELLDCQTKLTENHETLRELLISRRRHSGKSAYQGRRLLIFQQLVDILELAMANPVNYYTIDEIFAKDPKKLQDFREAMQAFSRQMIHIAAHFGKPRKLQRDTAIKGILQGIEKDLKSPSPAEADPVGITDFLSLKNYLKYLHAQLEKIQNIERLITTRKFKVRDDIAAGDKAKFLTRSEYRLSTLVENLNARSPIFRHSLRIALVAMVGYALGSFFDVQKSYWILLTVVVIMRPNFGLTKTRFKQRTAGTLIGGVVAFAIIFLIHDLTLYGILSILSFVIGFSMVQRNYRLAAVFITMYILFVYALISPEVFEVIQFRVVDTLIGAGLSYMGNLFLWPSWEIQNIDETLAEALKANRAYLKEIAHLYNSKTEEILKYKLARKTAFLKLSDLNSSFQRMTQEPKAQHQNLNEIFQLVMLMHSFLASLASLGSYILHNPTTPASDRFNLTINQITNNLKESQKQLGKLSQRRERMLNLKVEEIEETQLEELRDPQINETLSVNKESPVEEEAHLITEQFKWLLSNSQRMNKILNKIRFS